MLRLTMILFSMISTALMGTAIIIVLTLGWVDLTSILASAAIGFLLAIPASWIVARNIA
ncbi:MAG: CTP synthetase [Tabrizicola sp.]|uniref:CTP synthetase n=1 Tax=Tabrizicola sp. TaxID=2005166 RepID=UPI002732F70D|nr:CTP synthetase [Tabrizicola sp.]MDP3261909.1 CTP synthetase [Tabrizicola sp.]MDP3649993.1 CTP synthetase [Paracoccaceae bacterium]MDZ4069347.1 CTP synthetase [Tabrizicola sp.]